MEDKYNLKRFVDAQQHVYPIALKELRDGRKRSHWIWYIFPQLKSLGYSYNAKYYGISGLEEAIAYLNHPVLGARLREVSETMLNLDADDAVAVLGGIDAIKLRSSMTLFDFASPNDVFARVLQKYFNGQRDNKSMSVLAPEPESDNPTLKVQPTATDHVRTVADEYEPGGRFHGRINDGVDQVAGACQRTTPAGDVGNIGYSKRRSRNRGKAVIAIIMVILFIAALSTPSRTEGKARVKQYLTERIKDFADRGISKEGQSDDLSDGIEKFFVNAFTPLLIEGMVDVEYTDCIFFATFKASIKQNGEKSKLVSGMILFGKIIPLSN